jgi:hypothetical protein
MARSVMAIFVQVSPTTTAGIHFAHSWHTASICLDRKRWDIFSSSRLNARNV